MKLSSSLQLLAPRRASKYVVADASEAAWLAGGKCRAFGPFHEAASLTVTACALTPPAGRVSRKKNSRRLQKVSWPLRL